MGERGGAFSVEGVPMRELRKSKPSVPGCIVPTLRKSRRVGLPVVYSLPRKAGPARRWSSYRFYFLGEGGPVRVNEGWSRISFRDRAA